MKLSTKKRVAAVKRAKQETGEGYSCQNCWHMVRLILGWEIADLSPISRCKIPVAKNPKVEQTCTGTDGKAAVTEPDLPSLRRPPIWQSSGC
ncbi:unnamed protein product [Boreogadus saida]